MLLTLRQKICKFFLFLSTNNLCETRVFFQLPKTTQTKFNTVYTFVRDLLKLILGFLFVSGTEWLQFCCDFFQTEYSEVVRGWLISLIKEEFMPKKIFIRKAFFYICRFIYGMIDSKQESSNFKGFIQLITVKGFESRLLIISSVSIELLVYFFNKNFQF